ncbi:unnamed protein product [Dibothriocephalus latus]|uniref:Uncharacterized protein n=1 Tax=Dibothriocephalus latus TaxID=60516 RepID=A0A3P7MQL8_DIBLA|nr:unnamed protein product [Dibothriocephalus latus]
MLHGCLIKTEFMRLRLLLAVLVALVALCWTLSISPFLWGVVVGAFVAYCCLRSYALLMDYLYCTRDSGYGCCNTTMVSPSAYCCSLHNANLASWRPPYGPLVPPILNLDGGLPTLRDLPPPTVPHISDEDPKSGPSSGPLADSLGFKVDQHNKPVYKGWMNEVGRRTTALTPISYLFLMPSYHPATSRPPYTFTSSHKASLLSAMPLLRKSNKFIIA